MGRSSVTLCLVLTISNHFNFYLSREIFTEDFYLTLWPRGPNAKTCETERNDAPGPRASAAERPAPATPGPTRAGAIVRHAATRKRHPRASSLQPPASKLETSQLDIRPAHSVVSVEWAF